MPPRSRPIASEPQLRIHVVAERGEAERAVAAEIASLVRERAARREHAVLGLATGSSPLGVYAELVRLHRAGEVSFAQVLTFNLDEYVGVSAEHPCSFRRCMDELLFRPLELPRQAIHFPDVESDVGDRAWLEACRRYEEDIRRAGGIDLQLLGIGRNGHLAFNEPGSARESRTRLVALDPETREDAERSFTGRGDVPARALTMGIATILEARALRVLAFGAQKAAIVRRALRDPIGPETPATYLREHPDVELWLDRAAAAEIDG
jgi:glucosamine-6-phosphate deaminase